MRRINIKLISNLLLLLIVGSFFVNITFGSYWSDPGPDLPRIYIRNDGRVEPETSPVFRDENTYKLTGDIVNSTLEIQCDNIVLDGEGHIIQGNASRIKGYDDGNNGVVIDGQKNVTIKNINFEQDQTGIRILNSSNLTLLDNTFNNGIYTGILIQGSNQILIENNSFVDLYTDISIPAVLLDGSKIMFRNNMVLGSSYGVKIIGPSNVISRNKIQ
jgi:parallel beta-helix repeat protein